MSAAANNRKRREETRALARVAGKPAFGQIVSTSPLTVSIEGAAAVPAKKCASYLPAVDDLVVVLSWGGYRVILDQIDD